jgi:hypothetical protein
MTGIVTEMTDASRVIGDLRELAALTSNDREPSAYVDAGVAARTHLVRWLAPLGLHAELDRPGIRGRPARPFAGDDHSRIAP